MHRWIDALPDETVRRCGLDQLTDAELTVVGRCVAELFGELPHAGTLRSVMPGGRVIELDDGSLWQISADDAGIADGWQVGQHLMVTSSVIFRLNPDDAVRVARVPEVEMPSDSQATVDDDRSIADRVKEIMETMPSLIDPAAVVGETFAIQYELAGEGGGDWYLEVADGWVHVERGVHPSPSMTMTLSARDYVDLIAGDLDGQAAFLDGRLRISGELGLAARMQDLFRER